MAWPCLQNDAEAGGLISPSAHFCKSGVGIFLLPLSYPVLQLGGTLSLARVLFALGLGVEADTSSPESEGTLR